MAIFNWPIFGTSGGLPPIGTTLENCTWAQIDAVSKAGLATNYWAVGDSKTMSILGSTVTAHIAGFNSDTFTSGATAGITFVTDILSTSYVYSSNYWNGSTLRPLMQPGGSIYTTMPSDLTALLQPVSVRSYTVLTNNATAATGTGITNDYCWIPGWHDTFGGSNTYDGSVWYTYFQTTANRIQSQKWWIRVPHPNSTGYCCIVTTSGGKSYVTYSTTTYVRMLFAL